MEQFIEALLALVANSANNLVDTLPVGYAVYYWLTIGDLGETIKGFF